MYYLPSKIYCIKKFRYLLCQDINNILKLEKYNRFAIDSMQSICLDEAGGEKVVDPSSQETTLIHHIFGGHLQSQVVLISLFIHS